MRHEQSAAEMRSTNRRGPATQVLICLSILALALLSAQTARAEGAVKLVDCSIVRTCDAAGVCQQASGEVSFRMEPVKLAVAGGGTYSISYGDTRADMQALSDIGPFVWTVGSERDALLPSSETQWLWHRLTTDPAPQATIQFLTCSFQQ